MEKKKGGRKGRPLPSLTKNIKEKEKEASPSTLISPSIVPRRAGGKKIEKKRNAASPPLLPEKPEKEPPFFEKTAKELFRQGEKKGKGKDKASLLV